jgi:hypothetical protein
MLIHKSPKTAIPVAIDVDKYPIHGFINASFIKQGGKRMLKKCLFGLFVVFLCAGFAFANQTENPPNGDSTQANGPIVFNDLLTGGLPGGWLSDPNPDQDYWRFSGTNAIQYKFTGVAKNTMVNSLYIGLDIENSVGGIVASQSASSPNQTVVLNWTCGSTGTYYLVVYEATAYQNGTAYYEVTCEQVSGVEDWSLY